MRGPKQYCLQLDIHHTVFFIRAHYLLLTILPILICGGRFLRRVFVFLLVINKIYLSAASAFKGTRLAKILNLRKQERIIYPCRK